MQQYTLRCQTLFALSVCVCVWWVFALPSVHLLKSVLLFNLFVSHFFLFLFLLHFLLLLSTRIYFSVPLFTPPTPHPTATAVFDVLVSPLNCYKHSILRKRTVGGGKKSSGDAVWEGFPENSWELFRTFTRPPL